jgi:hypothetical protein
MASVLSIYQRAVNDARARLYMPTANELSVQLPEIGEGIAAACTELAKNPTPDGAERLAARFTGVSRFAMQLNSALIRETEPQPPRAA